MMRSRRKKQRRSLFSCAVLMKLWWIQSSALSTMLSVCKVLAGRHGNLCRDRQIQKI
ncbi:unnamed protein product [Strongylus vulgaris]|uniref:Uncharacterized protein n=1 Tax=Strongylus vulgaris TaxID=40348 RepID=A0A3P7KC99_STRVU|nr:unnamed protein product [Strongylus vulgaris]